MKNFDNTKINDSKHLIGIVGILQGQSAALVKKIWKDFEKKYGTVKVQSFPHPHITFQGGLTSNLNELKSAFEKFGNEVSPFQLKAEGIGYFENNIIYIKINRKKEILNLNKNINHFLKSHCDELVEQYSPLNWVPHITLAMEDIKKKDFKNALKDLENFNLTFSETVGHLTLVKLQKDNTIKII